MKTVAAYNLLKSVNQDATKAKIIELFNAVGGAYDETEIDMFLSKVGSKSYESLVEEGSKLMASFSAAAAPKAAAAVETKEEKKEEKPKVEEKEEDLDLDFFN